MAIGPNPRLLEELRIGGGFGDSADGGADLEKNGDISTDGSVTLKGLLSAGSTPQTLTDSTGLIDGGKIQNGTVDTTELADDAVTPAKLDATGDFIVNSLQLNGGGNVGTDSDTDLLGIADDVLTVNGAVGIGTASPGDYHATANQLVIAGTGASKGLTIVTDSDKSGNIFFADGTVGSDPLKGYIQYQHGNELLAFGVNAGTVMSLLSGGNVGIGVTDPGTKLEVNGDVSLTGGGNIGTDTDTDLLGIADNALTVNGSTTLGAASTDTINCTGRLLVRSVTDAGPMTATAGTVAEIVYNTSDSKFYGCTATGSPATWSALN